MKYIMQAMFVAGLITGTPAFADDPANVLAPKSTYADAHAAGTAKGAMVSAFPSSVDDAGISMPSKSTYADRFGNDKRVQVRGISDPVLIQ